ncbi:MAG: glutamine-hydrolyzing GMP synthase [Candidatus Dasytiphilus stammeri]
MIENIHRYRILIIDFGSQYTQLIARRIREIGVYCELFPWNLTEEHLIKFKPNGIILSGGPESTTEPHSPRAPDYVFKVGCPVLGICYGMHLMAIQLGGKVEKTSKREFGSAQVKVVADSMLIHDIKDALGSKGSLLEVWMSHGDKVTVLPSDFISLAANNSCPIAMMANEQKSFYGVQFHPEVTHTKQGHLILKRFVCEICACKSIWIPVNIIEDIVITLYHQMGNNQVILGLSGGIDSLVTAILLHHAIGRRLTCIFIDNGLLRVNDITNIDILKNLFGLQVTHISAEERFISALAGITDPEIKRKIIGRIFINIFHEIAEKSPSIKWLAQGTIYPDIIESIGQAQLIKSHHNVGGLPKNMKLGLVEPLKKLFKDEVRKIGLELKIPHDILYRHPFPGPGLGVRILGEVKPEYCKLLRHADSIFIEELYKANLYYKISQAFAVFIPVRSVGIMGDARKYDWVIALRAVETVDFMTAKWVKLPYDFLEGVSNRILNEVPGISRVVYDISSKPPATIEWE